VLTTSRHAGSLLGCTDLCCPTSYHPLHAPIIIHHAPPIIVHHSTYHTPITYHSSYHPYPTSSYPRTSYHPSTYHRTSYYRHYLMVEGPAKLRTARVAMWGSVASAVVLACGILWIRQRSRLPPML